MRDRSSGPKAQTVEPNAKASFQLWESQIHAFVALCEGHAAAQCDGKAQSDAPLAGITVGVKDIIDVSGVPTRNGSDACAAAAPAERDAPVVAALRAAAAQIVGKTTTTEFAFTDPTDCRNPHDLARSPGGSSSGSGVTPLAPSFDTIGVIAKSVNLAERSFRAMLPDRAAPVAKEPGRCVSVSSVLESDAPPNAELFGAFRDAEFALNRICGERPSPALPLDVAQVVADHRIVMNHEA